MAILSISEAARHMGCARSTIQRKIKDGSLSATRQPDGTRGVDTAELYRAMGEPRSAAQGVSAAQHETEQRELDMIQQQLDAMRQELDAARSREEWYQEQLEAAQKERRELEQRLLSAPEKRGWFRRWRR